MKTNAQNISEQSCQASIRHLAASQTGTLVAAGEFEHQVHIWDLADKKCVRTVKTILDFGGSRLAISCDGRHLIAGSYELHGVTCYSVESGSPVWQQPNLATPQIIHFSIDDNYIIVGSDDRNCWILDRKTGCMIKQIPGVKNIIESAWEPILFASTKSIEIRTAEHKLLSAIPRATSSELAVTFAKHHVIISETAGPIRCCETLTGREVWKHHEEGRHALHLAYTPSTETVMAIDWAYERGSSYRLMRFDGNTGHAVAVTEMEPQEVAFCLQGKCLLAADGTIRDTSTGGILGQVL